MSESLLHQRLRVRERISSRSDQYWTPRAFKQASEAAKRIFLTDIISTYEKGGLYVPTPSGPRATKATIKAALKWARGMDIPLPPKIDRLIDGTPDMDSCPDRSLQKVDAHRLAYAVARKIAGRSYKVCAAESGVDSRVLSSMYHARRGSYAKASMEKVLKWLNTPTLPSSHYSTKKPCPIPA